MTETSISESLVLNDLNVEESLHYKDFVMQIKLNVMKKDLPLVIPHGIKGLKLEEGSYMLTPNVVTNEGIHLLPSTQTLSVSIDENNLSIDTSFDCEEIKGYVHLMYQCKDVFETARKVTKQRVLK